MPHHTSIVWLRRDLRLGDNACLARACGLSDRVCLAFVLDPALLGQDRMGAPLVSVFFDAIANLREDLHAAGSDLAILRGDFSGELLTLARRIGATAVFFNEDYEPSAVARDPAVSRTLRDAGLEVCGGLDHVYFGADEVVQSNGEPYRVYTPYKRRWLEQRAVSPRLPNPSKRMAEGRLISREALGATQPLPRCEDFGFASSARYPKASEARAERLLTSFLALDGPAEHYRDRRNYPALPATSFLSPQLRAGTIGVRTCVEAAFARQAAETGEVRASIETWIGELVWRDFYQAILKNFPHVATGPFRASGKSVAWRTSQSDFQSWCEGRTGLPIVDAAMRQLNETGWMHNRLRMIAASFLSKHLLIDWRLGERYFEQRLADADLAQNNGGWQWASSTGTDAAPYFRIFNPVVQGKRFDPDGAFVRAMLPELRDVPNEFVHEPWRLPRRLDYPPPLVDHASARARAIAAFAAAFSEEKERQR